MVMVRIKRHHNHSWQAFFGHSRSPDSHLRRMCVLPSQGFPPMTGFRRRTPFSMPTVLVKCGAWTPFPCLHRCLEKPLRQGCLCTYYNKNYIPASGKMQPIKSPPDRVVRGAGGHLPKVRQQRMRMVAIWARLAVPWGTRVSAVMPWTIPFSTAQPKAASA